MDPAPAAGPPPLASAWPRPAQLAAAFLLGVVVTLLAVRLWGGGPPQPLDLRHAAIPGHAIDLARAPAAELQQLPGIGPKLANRIAEYRDVAGTIDVTGLTNVPGVGPGRLERARPWVRTDADDPSARSPFPSKKADAIKDAVDVNRASAEELQKLPGIGVKTAQRILDERAKGPFATVDDLRRVPGIGPKTLEKLRPFVTVGGDAARSAVPPVTPVEPLGKPD